MPLLLNNDKDVNKIIALCGSQSAKFAENYHIAAYNSLAAIAANGDIRRLQRLYDVVSGVKTKSALVQYSLAFGKVRFKTKEQVFVYAAKKEGDLIGAEKIGPVDYVRAVTPRVKAAFDLKAEIAKLTAKAIKAHITGKPVDLLNQAIAAL